MKKMYIAPEVEVLDVMVEKGFAGSPVLGGDTPAPGADEPIIF